MKKNNIRKLIKISEKIDKMTLKEKTEFANNLKNKIKLANEELDAINRSIKYINENEIIYMPRYKKKIITLCIELSCCIVGGVIAGLTPSLNFMFGVAFGFLISVPLDLLVHINIDSRFIRAIVNKAELTIQNARKNKTLSKIKVSEQSLELLKNNLIIK